MSILSSFALQHDDLWNEGNPMIAHVATKVANDGRVRPVAADADLVERPEEPEVANTEIDGGAKISSSTERQFQSDSERVGGGLGSDGPDGNGSTGANVDPALES